MLPGVRARTGAFEPVFAMGTIVRCGKCDSFFCVWAEISFAVGAMRAILRVVHRVNAELAAAVEFAHFVRDDVVATAMLCSFGL
jgi:hypothetical protein